jgi:hypothetical protein
MDTRMSRQRRGKTLQNVITRSVNRKFVLASALVVVSIACGTMYRTHRASIAQAAHPQSPEVDFNGF